ncbi:MAG TPA: glycosyltransferase, partial [Pseudomonas sp.]|uniref:glycosyltransferase n=1 Tax=Pseudomonas sp. TaxID=306 RepID=UPI002EDB2573
LVSILIPTKDQLNYLQRCVESVLEKTRYFNYEIIIVDNNSQTPEAINWLAEMDAVGGQKVRVLRYPYPFNFSAINNLAARESKGDYLVLLNNDTAVMSEDWLDALLNHALRPEVGIVGAKLLYPNGDVQHAGVIVGLDGPAGHPFIGLPATSPGYMQRLMVDQNYSAVTAACLMIRKSIYDEVDGLDEESFKVSYNDVDLCLKVGALGYLTVWTPHAVLLHEGSVSQNTVDVATLEAKLKRFSQEQESMYSKWLPVLAADPAYNRNLSVNGGGFDLDGRSQLSWRPLAWRPLPIILGHPADTQVSATRRITQPFEQLRDAGQVDGMISRNLLGVVELQRYEPDIIVLQRRIDPPRLALMRKIKRFSNAFKVLDIDHYPSGLDFVSSVNGSGTDIGQSIHTALSHVDRLVVPTASLADVFLGRHMDIRIIPTLLSPGWANVQSRLEPAARPRVGCFMGTTQGIDFPLIEAVFKALSNEVDWIFLGKAPLELRDYAHETHLTIHAQHEPDKLAALNLDLALIALTPTVANHCRSNILALEYGACAIPVIASDVEGLRGTLPLTLMNNEPTRWIEAIRAVLNDRDAYAQQGQQLRAQVNAHWISTRDSADRLLKAWLPT